nr:LPS biosynthesis protein [Edwardsiella hoshinae]
MYQDGFVWDYAGHFFHFANDNVKSFFKKRINESEFVSRIKSTKIFYKGNFIDFPFQTNIHQLDKDEFIDCLYDLYFRDEKVKYDSFLDMLYGNFGKSITNKFLKPYNEKLYACDLTKLDKDAMGRFFPYADMDKIVKGFKCNYTDSYNARFLYPKNGAKVFVDALASGVSKDKVILENELLEIYVKEKVAITKGIKIKYKHLINTTTLPIFLSMIKDIKYSNFINSLSWNKVLVFNIGFDLPAINNDIHWMYFPEEKYNFYRVGFYSNILSEDRLSIYVEVGFGSSHNINIDVEFDKVILGLKIAGIIDDHKVISYSSIIMDPAYVHIDDSIINTKKNVFSELLSYGVYNIGRYGDWKYCSIEDSMLDAISLARKI